MRIHAVVRTTNYDPETPRIGMAWSEETAHTHPDAVRSGLADALQDPETERAAIVQIEVPDKQLLRGLSVLPPVAVGTFVEEA